MKTSARGTRTHLHRVPSVSWLPDVFEPVPFCKKTPGEPGTVMCPGVFLVFTGSSFRLRRAASAQLLSTTRH